MEKILIVGSSTIDKMKIAERLTEYDDSLKIAYTFTSDLNYQQMKKDTRQFYHLDRI